MIELEFLLQGVSVGRAIDTEAVSTAQVVAEGTITTELLLDAVVRIIGFGLLACGAAATAAFAYRWYSTDEIPDGVAVLAGVAVVAVWLNTKSALGDAIIGGTPLFDPVTAVYTVVTFAVSAIAADGGRRLGDYLARDVFAVSTSRTFDQMTQLVRSAGRVISVSLPETIEDADGYDPVSEEVKTDLAGSTLLFPRGLTVEDLEARLVSRLERDHGVGHVDVSLTVEGAVEHLAIGSRRTGLGPTLSPGTVAVAIHADPAPDASPGDAIEVWHSSETQRSDGGSRPHAVEASEDPSDERTTGDREREGTLEGETGVTRLASAELRGTVGDVATISLAADDVADLSSEEAYRLVTLPGMPDAGREFVSLLRAVNEMVTAVTVSASGGDGTIAGESVGSLPVAVLALEREGEAISLPDGEETLECGDVAYLLGRPEAFRRLHESGPSQSGRRGS